ncbi:chorismate mutase [soil metagenome]
MLVEPELDAESLARDRVLAEALDAVMASRLAQASAPTPDADAIALRAFLSGNAGFRQAAILRAVWGRLTAATLPPLVACGPAAVQVAADRYGLPVRTVAEPDAALAEALAGARAVIDIAAPKPWWGRLLARPELQVIAALPDDTLGLPRALVVSKETGGPTGDDRTFWVTDSALPETKLVQALAATGLVGHPLIASGGLKLVVLAGYVQGQDGRLSAAPGALKGVIGAAPVY